MDLVRNSLFESGELELWRACKTMIKRLMSALALTALVLPIGANSAPGLGIDWEMPSRFWFDLNGDGRPDIPNNADYVSNVGGRFAAPGRASTQEACHQSSLTAPRFQLGLIATNVPESPEALGVASFRWTITSRSTGQSVQVESSQEEVTTCLTEGVYDVQLRYRRGTVSAEAAAPVPVKDILIVSLGDSYSSGEGNPEQRLIASANSPAMQFPTIDEKMVLPLAGGQVGFPVFVRWADAGVALTAGGTTPPTVENARHVKAHRSSLAWPAQLAERIQRDLRGKASVTFVFLAASGATVRQGLLGPYKGAVETPPINDDLPPQLAEAAALVGNRRIDILLLSIGGNDIGFSSIPVALLLRRPNDGCVRLKTIKTAVNSGDWQFVENEVNSSGSCGALTWAREMGLGKMPRFPDALPGLNGLAYVYADLRRALASADGQVKSVDGVYMLTYPSPVHANGAPCNSPVLTDLAPVSREIGKTEIRWLANELLVALNFTIRNTAAMYGWRTLEPPPDFLYRGLCVGGTVASLYESALFSNYNGNPYPGALAQPQATTRFFRRGKEAASVQGPYDESGKTKTRGTLHPNEYAHVALADAFLPQVELPIRLPGSRRTPGFDVLAEAERIRTSPNFLTPAAGARDATLQSGASVRMYALEMSANSALSLRLQGAAEFASKLAVTWFDASGRRHDPPPSRPCSTRAYKLADPASTITGAPVRPTSSSASTMLYAEDPGTYFVGISWRGNDNYDPLFGLNRVNVDMLSSGATSPGVQSFAISLDGEDPDARIPCANVLAGRDPGPVLVSGYAVDSPDDVDLFEVELSAGTTLKADVSARYSSHCPLNLGPTQKPLAGDAQEALNSTLDPEARIFDAFGRQVGSFGRQAEFAATEAGRYFVAVASRGRYPYSVADPGLEDLRSPQRDPRVSGAGFATEGVGMTQGQYRLCISSY